MKISHKQIHALVNIARHFANDLTARIVAQEAGQMARLASTEGARALADEVAGLVTEIINQQSDQLFDIPEE